MIFVAFSHEVCVRIAHIFLVRKVMANISFTHFRLWETHSFLSIWTLVCKNNIVFFFIFLVYFEEMVILNIRSRCFHCNMFNRVTWFHDTGVLLCKIKFFLFFCVIPVFCTNPAVGLEHNIVFSNRWTVEIENDSNVDEIASKFGLINHGKVSGSILLIIFYHHLLFCFC